MRRPARPVAAPTPVLETLEPRQLMSATAGLRDVSFGTKGFCDTHVPGTVYKQLLQADGKTVVLSVAGKSGLMKIERLDATTGQLDPTFGHGTGTITPAGDVYDATLTTDGKLVTAGTDNATGNLLVARYNADGSPDTSFNGTGVLATRVGGAATGPAADVEAGTAVEAKSNGQIYVVDDAYSPSHQINAYLLARITAAGQVDTSWTATGTVPLPAAPAGYTATLLIDNPDPTGVGFAGSAGRRLLLAGYAARSGYTQAPYVVDPTAAFGPANDQFTLTSVAPAADGHHMAFGGYVSGPHAGTTGVVGQLWDDEPDGAFNGGLGYEDVPVGPAGVVTSVMVEADSKILVATQPDVGGGQIGVERLNPDGSVDPTFATGGTATTDLSGPGAAVLLADGQVQVAGATNVGSVGLERLTGDVLTGTVIRAPGVVNEGSAFDGNPGSDVYSTNADGGWVGLDLGAPRVVTAVSFMPVETLESWMAGGKFQASDTPDFSSGVVTLHTIGSAPVDGMATVDVNPTAGAWRYVRYLSPVGGYCAAAELRFFGQVGRSMPTAPTFPPPSLLTAAAQPATFADNASAVVDLVNAN